MEQSAGPGQSSAALAAATTPTPAQQQQYPPQHSYHTPPFTATGGTSTRSHASSGSGSEPFHSPVPTATATATAASVSAASAGAARGATPSFLHDDDIQRIYIDNPDELLNCVHASMLASQRAAEHFAIDVATQRLQDLAEESEDLFSERANPAANADSNTRMTSVSPESHGCSAYDEGSAGSMSMSMSMSIQLPSPLHSQAHFASPGAVRSPRATYATQITPRTAASSHRTPSPKQLLRSGAAGNGTSSTSSGGGRSGGGSGGRSGPSPSPFPTQRWNPNRGVTKLADCTAVEQQVDVLAVVLQIDPACHVATRNGAAGLLNLSIGDPSYQHFQISIWGQRAISVRLNPGDVVRITKISVRAFQGRFTGSLLRHGTIHQLGLAAMRTTLPSSWPPWCKLYRADIELLGQWCRTRYPWMVGGQLGRATIIKVPGSELEENQVVHFCGTVCGRLETVQLPGADGRVQHSIKIGDAPGCVLDLVFWDSPAVRDNKYSALIGQGAGSRGQAAVTVWELRSVLVRRCRRTDQLQLHTLAVTTIQPAAAADPDARRVSVAFAGHRRVDGGARGGGVGQQAASTVTMVTPTTLRTAADGVYRFECRFSRLRLGALEITQTGADLRYAIQGQAVSGLDVWDSVLFRGCIHCGNELEIDAQNMPVSCQKNACFKDAGVISEQRWVPAATAFVEDDSPDQPPFELEIGFGSSDGSAGGAGEAQKRCGDRQALEFFKTALARASVQSGAALDHQLGDPDLSKQQLAETCALLLSDRSFWSNVVSPVSVCRRGTRMLAGVGRC